MEDFEHKHILIEDYVDQLEVLYPVKEHVTIAYPDDWNALNYKKVNIIDVKISMDGYETFYFKVGWDEKEQKWSKHDGFHTDCKVCGHYFANSLEEILSLAFKHYVCF